MESNCFSYENHEDCIEIQVVPQQTLRFLKTKSKGFIYFMKSYDLFKKSYGFVKIILQILVKSC